ncbi:MAG: hypothetical protein P1R58_11105 [bacterium]|nr:hypothetical protein [bacterium]
MNPLMIKRVKAAMFGLIIFSLALALTVNFTGLFVLEAVEVDGAAIENWPEQFNLLSSAPIMSLPVDSLASQMLSRKGVHKVDLSLTLPDKVVITTNRFEPVCLILSQSTGRMYALDQSGRVIPIPSNHQDAGMPVISGTECGRLYQRCRDQRLPSLIEDMVRLREENTDLYYLIEEIDLTESACAVVTVVGLDYRLKVRTHAFRTDMLRFTEFVTRFDPMLEGTKYLDFLNDNMIVRRNRRG